MLSVDYATRADAPDRALCIPPHIQRARRLDLLIGVIMNTETDNTFRSALAFDLDDLEEKIHAPTGAEVLDAYTAIGVIIVVVVLM